MADRDNDVRDDQAHAGGKTPPVSWNVWLKTARPFSLTASVSPVLVGTAVAAYDGTFHLLNFLAALCSSLFLQVGANYFNEYFDYRYELDSPESLGFSTVIFRHEMTAAFVLAVGAGRLLIATAFGPALILLSGPAIILFGIVGMAIDYFYSAKPIK